jgi:Zn ribbon nucleic-acid-binding protein
MRSKNNFQPKISNCDICGDEYLQSSHKASRCEKCKSEDLKRCQKHNEVILSKQKSCPKCSLEKSLEKYNDENKDDWIECPLCGYRAGDLGQHIIKHHNMTTENFRQITGFTSIKSKNQCERISGDKNPAYQHGGKFSPFSENFIHASKTNIKEIKEKATKTRIDNDGIPTRIGYWLKKTNGNLEEAQKLLSDRQSTFSLEKCVEKYGEEEGKQRWLDRQEKWHKNYKKSNFSKISQELFWGIVDVLPSNSLQNIFFAQLDENKEKDISGKNNELKLILEKVILPDFIDTSTNKIIEFDGVYWHGNVGHGNKTREKERDEILLNNKYIILHINESDYLNNKTEIINKCKNFLIQ